MAAGATGAKAIGGTGPASSRRRSDETETDLFGEQRCCAAAPRKLVTAVRGGRSRLPCELAYFEVLHELKLIVDLMYEAPGRGCILRC